MALIALRNIRCIDYLAYGAIFTRVSFFRKKKVMFFWIFFPARKAQDVLREEVPLKDYITDSVSSFNSASESDI
jgi:hypothetical protein